MLLDRFGQSNNFSKKSWKKFWTPSEGPLGDVLGTFQINLPGTSLKRQIRTSPERSNRIFRGRPVDVGGGRPRDVPGTNIFRLGRIIQSINGKYGSKKINAELTNTCWSKQLLIKIRESVSLKDCNDSKSLAEYSSDRDDVYGNVHDYNPNKKQKLLIISNFMTADMLRSKKLQSIVTKLLIILIFFYTTLFDCTKKN